MEWSVGETSERYTAKLTDTEGTLALTGFTSDGVEQAHSEISVARDNQPGRLLVEVNGQAQFAHVAKVGDSWWIHLDGRIHVVNGHETGSADSSAGEGGGWSYCTYAGDNPRSSGQGGSASPRRPDPAGDGGDEDGTSYSGA